MVKLIVKLICVIIAFASCQSLLAQTDSTAEKKLFTQKGNASYYAKKFEGRKTANGEKYRRRLLTAAHKTLPFNTKVKVSNPKNGRWVIVRINDRGPYHKKRIIDLSERAARHLGIFGGGHTRVIIQEVPDSAQVWINQSQQ
ncbi:MAG: septal ring lytic transglycosylase RlpA family protein [Bacteroidia bacterium]|nr:septal ring lytic transglycosylase RlpA family protein [Bacteroidia bacterium]